VLETYCKLELTKQGRLEMKFRNQESAMGSYLWFHNQRAPMRSI